MTDAQVREFFSDYEAAFDRLDAGAVAGFFDIPSVIVEAPGTRTFSDRAAVHSGITALTRYYRSIGFVSAEATRIDTEHVSENTAEVDVTWTLHLGTGDASFSTRYWLVERAGHPRVAAVLAYSEARSLAERERPDA